MERFSQRELRARMAELFDLPGDLVAGLSHMELLGDRQFFLEGHTGILSYAADAIDINAGGIVIRVRGENLTLRAMTEDMSRYARLESVFLKKTGQMEEKKVLKGRSYDGFAFLQLEGVNDRDAAEALRGAEVYVDRRHAIKLGADENFVCELIGLRAVDETGETIGTLRDVLKPNAVCDVYVFNTPRGELMIPALKRVVKTVDVDAGVMTLDSAALAEVAVWEDEPAERDE